MDGNISVESTYGEGTTFHLYIRKIKVSSIVVQRKDEKKEQQFIFEKATILLVDDIQNNRELVQQHFKETEITILSAENGKVATEIALNNEIDLVLMDIRMPVMDGYEAAKIIKELKPNLTIIALTASVMEDEFERVKSGNFDGYLRKPILSARLFKELSLFLKFNYVEKVEIIEDDSIVLSTKTKENKDNILQNLESDISPIYEKVKSANNMNDTKIFAQSLLELSDKYEILHVEKYANKLLNAIDIFDIMSIKELLSKYEDIISSIK